MSVGYDACHIYGIHITPEMPSEPRKEFDGMPEHLACLQAWFEGYLSGCAVQPDLGAMKLFCQVTAFSQDVYDAVSAIPFGEVRTYQDIACAIGRAGACRAVGTAVRRNPFHILVPCHRVISKTGDPFLFAAGADKKSALLAHEKRLSILC